MFFSCKEKNYFCLQPCAALRILQVKNKGIKKTGFLFCIPILTTFVMIEKTIP